MNGPAAGTPRLMMVFVSYENPSPEALAQQMMADLQIQPGAAAVGVDLLTGGCEVRLYYDPLLLAHIRAYCDERNIVHDVSFL